MKTVLKILLCFLFPFIAKAQDPIFTQFFMVPEIVNPGFTGYLETTNAAVIHRTQWPDLDFRVDTDLALINLWSDNLRSGYGINLRSHREKFTNFNFNQINLAYAYKVDLTDEWVFRPGVEIGFGNKTFGFQNLILKDQINIGSGTINSSSIDPSLANERVSFFDFSAGMLFVRDRLWFGASLKHINKPNISFTSFGNLPLEMFLNVGVGYEFDLTESGRIPFFPDGTKLMCTSNFMKQGTFNRLDFATSLVFNSFYLGVGASTTPKASTAQNPFLVSINAFGGLQYDHFKIGYSYDFNTSKIGKTGGVYEIFLTYQFDLSRKCVGCPDYY